MRAFSELTARSARWWIVLVAFAFCSVTEAVAGMPAPTLGDVRRVLGLSNLTRMRLETVSFFLVGLFACALVIRAVWNGLRSDFPWLPRLSIGKALGLVVLWGLLFVLVLTMISGARELMTPGAWEKKGLTYQLVEDGPSAIERQITERHEAIERLNAALRAYAVAHEAQFPTPEAATSIPDLLWVVPGSGGQRYVYRGGRDTSSGTSEPGIVAYEPDAFGPDRLVILSNGTILWLPIAEIEQSPARGRR